MTAADLADRIGAKRRSDGKWWDARCPAHEDHKASLSFTDGDHKLIVRCHRGCSEVRITAALGIRLADLVNSHSVGSRMLADEVATYDYTDEGGNLLFQTVRFANPKDFRQRRPDGGGEWIWNLDGVRRVLYRLPDLAEQREAFVVEGEKDADRLMALGLTATCNAMGAGKWTDDHTAQLVTVGVERVVVLADLDTAGVAHAHAVAASCRRAGLSAKLIMLPDLGPVQPKGGKDVSDWLDARHGFEDLRALVDATAEYAPTANEQTAPGSADDFHFVSLSDLLRRPPVEHRWLVKNRLPIGGLSVFAGKPKAGKSTTARALALAVARGEPWLGHEVTQGPVLYIAPEEKADEVRLHFAAMGAHEDENLPLYLHTSRTPTDALTKLRRAVERVKPVLIMVDTLARVMHVKDLNDYAQVTAALAPFMDLARETGAHLMVLHHLGKGDRVGADAVLGSTAIRGAVDTTLMLKRTEDRRVLSTEQRYGPDLPETVLTMDPDTRMVTAGPLRREADEADAKTAILAFLADQTAPASEQTILDGTEGDTGIRRRALRALVAAGKVERTGAGKKGDAYHYEKVVCSSTGMPANEQTRIANEGATPPGIGTYSRLPVSPAETLRPALVQTGISAPADETAQRVIRWDEV